MVPYNAISSDSVLGLDHVAIAQQLATEGLCLYKNSNSTLPLSPSSNVLLVGFQGNDSSILTGNYAESGTWA